MKQKMNPEAGKQYEYDGRIIEVTSLTEQGFYYEEVAIAHSKKRFAEYNSFIETRMVETKRRETNLEHYAEDLLQYINATECDHHFGEVMVYDDYPIRVICDNFVGKNKTDEFIKWCNEEYVSPKPKVTLFEHLILECAVNHGYEWIARDEKYNVVCVYENKPTRGLVGWQGRNIAPLWLFEDTFQFIKWEDKEPVNIKTLLEEAEIEGE